MVSSYVLTRRFYCTFLFRTKFSRLAQPPYLGVTSDDSCTRESILYPLLRSLLRITQYDTALLVIHFQAH